MGELHQQRPDGSWEPAEPEPYSPGLDFEVAGTGPWDWQAYDGGKRVAYGTAHTRIGLRFAVLRAHRRWLRKQRRSR